VQDSEALRRTQPEVERFCMTEFPDHCAGVSLVMGQAATAIKVEPVGKQPTPEQLAELLPISGNRLVVYRRPLGRRILTEQLGKGVNIREVSPRADGSGVRVVTPDARRVREQLPQRYGKAVIVTEGI
jgi:hypothetical protein